MSPHRQIADFIDARQPWYQDKMCLPLWYYVYCGRRVSHMSLEEASNIVQTRMSGY